MKVFLGGSKTLGALPRTVTERLTECIAERCTFLVGDCHGADLAFQKFLYDRKVEDVFVYCSGSAPRFNAGGWQVVALHSGTHTGYQFYAVKDIKMAEDADCAIMLWDGKSRGTYNNIERIKSMGKKAEVFLIKE